MWYMCKNKNTFQKYSYFDLGIRKQWCASLQFIAIIMHFIDSIEKSSIFVQESNHANEDYKSQ